jgi:cyanophycin synthetase
MNTTEPRDQLKVSTRVIYDELLKQGSSVDIIDNSSSLLEYTDNAGGKHFLFSTCSDKSSATGLIIAKSKAKSVIIAERIGVPTPSQMTCRDIREVRKFHTEHARIVIKPAFGSGGTGVSTNIKTDEALERAYHYAKTHSHLVIAQQHIIGDDVRLLIIDGKFCSAVIRKPAYVIGDGIATIEELINIANADLSRNDDTQSSLMHINTNAARRFLGDTMYTVAPANKTVRVVGPANVSLGGSLHEATTVVSQEMITDAEAISNTLDLGICGVDMMWDRKTNKHYFIEANVTPGIDIHNDPFSGTSSNAVELYVRWLLQ